MMQKDNITIRKAVPDDAPYIAIIEKECFSSPWSENSVLTEINNGLCIFLTALYDNKVCGYISGLNISGEFYISNIAVKKEYRNRHIASALMDETVSVLKKLNCCFATLEVRESNTAAINLYKNFGFELKGCRKNFYSKPDEDGLIYTLIF